MAIIDFLRIQHIVKKFVIRVFNYHFGLTDTGEDSKLVDRRKRSKKKAAPPRYLLFEFPLRPSDEYDSAPSRKYSRSILNVFACIG